MPWAKAGGLASILPGQRHKSKFCQEQVKGFSDPKHRRYDTRAEAQVYVDYWVNIDREAARQREERDREHTAQMSLQLGHDAAAREEQSPRKSGLGSSSAQSYNAGRLNRAPGPATAGLTLNGQRSRNSLPINESDLRPSDVDRMAARTDLNQDQFSAQHQDQLAQRDIRAPASHHECPAGPACPSPRNCLHSRLFRRP